MSMVNLPSMFHVKHYGGMGIVWRYWQGEPSPLEPWLHLAVRSLHRDVRDLNRDWLEDGCRDLVARNEWKCIPRDRAAHVSNMVRWWYLNRHGGIWLDHDVVPLRSLFGEAGEAWVSRIGHRYTSCAMQVPAGHPLCLAMLAAIEDAPPGLTSPETSGEAVLDRIMRGGDYPDVGAVALPHGSDGRATGAPDPALVHLWMTGSRIVLRSRGVAV